MTRLRFPRQGLYVITPDPPADRREDMLGKVAAAIRGGAAVVQYRAKYPADPLGEASLLRAMCRQAGIPLIVNDDVELAHAVGAEGVHLGCRDEALAVARQRLGPDAIVGMSCYDSVHRAREAERAGADYVAFGRFFPSSTKPHAPGAQLHTLREARRTIQLPLVAIGGIHVKNAGELLAAGADVLAVIEGVFRAEDPESAVREFRVWWPAD